MSTEPTSAVPETVQEVINLNHLLALNLDSQGGYETAADALKHEEYVDLFRQYAQQRQQNATELSNLIRTSDHTPDDTGSIPGLFQQGWINLESILSQGDAPVFAAVERADATILAAYQDVMGQTTREALMAVLREQFTEIRNAYERVKALRGALEQTHG
ncbi:MAG: PA2169 family four-helix-bundle protein [Caldilineaceae bacterium]